MLTLNQLKYLLIFIVAIRNVMGAPEWHEAADGNRYLIDPGYGYTWYDAIIECSSRNLSMVSITSEDKNKALMDVLRTTNGVFFWTGAIGTNSFHWVATGDPLEYTYWNDGEPNGQGKENCVLMDRQDYHWTDNSCLWRFSLVCEENPRDKRANNELANGIYGNSIFNSRLQSDISAIFGILSGLNDDAQSVQARNQELLSIE